MVVRNLPATLLLATSCLAIGACQTAPTGQAPATVAAAPAPSPAPAPQPATPAQLAAAVNLPHQTFTLANGLTVIVHEDHKAPVIGFGIWYNVGSKDEPKGKTGFAHLFEHLMFYGSENLRGGALGLLEELGASDFNGSTWWDRTNYYETVPKTNIEPVLFMESDRMGYLLGAVDQKKLDAQRAVVKNEKRGRANQPLGLLEYTVPEALFPPDHPYYHTTIGSMADLDSASLADVRQWFRDKYGPNNAIVALSGDITVPQAKALMEKYFGAIPAGKANIPAAADVPTLAAPKSLVVKDRIPTPQIERHWAVPGLTSPDLAALDLGVHVLGGLNSSRLDRILVREEKMAVSVSATLQPFHRLSFLEINATPAPGVDVAALEKRLDELVAQYLAEGPTAEELSRAATQRVASRIRAIETVGSQNTLLAEGKLYNNDSDFYKRRLAALAAVTPEMARTTLQRWMGRPVLAIRIEPGDRPPYVESTGPKKPAKIATLPAGTPRTAPPRGTPPALDFPTIQHTALSNGIPLHYAQRTAAPLTQVGLQFDAGVAADTASARGLQNMAISLLDEGTATRTGQAIAEEGERLGANLSASGSADRTTVNLSALSPNLGASLALMADVVRNPAFRPDDVERIRAQLVNAARQALANPNSIAAREYYRQLFGAGHAYGGTALGDVAAVEKFGAADLTGFQQRWLRPDNAELFVVSDRPLAEIKAALETAFGDWRAPMAPKGQKAFVATPAAAASGPRLVLIDRPGSPQSVIMGGVVTPLDPRGDNAASMVASDALGTASFGRVFQILREQKGWSYSPGSFADVREKAVPYAYNAAVQTDRTGDSVAELVALTRAIQSDKPVTETELRQSVASTIGSLAGQFESSSAVLGAMMGLDLLGRPDDYYETIPARYGALDLNRVNAAVRQLVDVNRLVFVVVGDAAKVRPQLDKLGYPIEVVQPR